MSQSPENVPEFYAGLNFEETKLTLGLPSGESRATKSGSKRGFSETVDLSLGNSSSSAGDRDCKKLVDDGCSEAKSPAIEAQVVGWPPVRASRKIAMKSGAGCKYVKVAVDGAPYLRKVDLEMYNSYQQLLNSLEGNYLSERTIMDHLNGMEYVPTYEDKDGDWMLVGDVPWNMFVESCKRLRLMKSSETIGLAPSTPSQSSSTCTR